MKRMTLLFACLGLVLLPGAAQATYVDIVDVYEYSIGGTISWSHTYDFSEILPISSVTLTIVADDVDDGEYDGVWLGGTTYLGDLVMLPTYSNWGYYPGPGNPDQALTISTFNINPLDLSGLMSLSVVVDADWGVEIETSTLTVQGVPEPGTLLLLGGGLIGLAARRRRRS